ncbi:MAG: KGK domain-containing protein [Thermosynechococcaceae cyanobacterium]
MHQKSLVLSKDDVISLEEKINNLSLTFKVDELLEDLQQKWAKNNDEKLASGRGLDCQVLRQSGQGWQTGKIRVVLEFCPDTPEEIETSAVESTSSAESPLETLRQETASNGYS